MFQGSGSQRDVYCESDRNSLALLAWAVSTWLGHTCLSAVESHSRTLCQVLHAWFLVGLPQEHIGQWDGTHVTSLATRSFMNQVQSALLQVIKASAQEFHL